MPSQAQIDKWKKQHGALHKIVVNIPGQDPAICIVRDPKVSDIQQSSSLGEGDEYKIGKIQLDNCWLAGDERIKTRLSVSQAAAKKMGAIFPVFPWKVDTIEWNSQMIPEDDLKALNSDLSKEVVDSIIKEGAYRRITILNGAKPIMNGKVDEREEIVAYFKCPDLEVKEKADLISDFLDQGATYINECFLMGDERFKNHTSEPIAFASYMAGHSLIEKFTTEVEKL